MVDPPLPPARPRVWTVFVALAAGVAGAFALQAVVAAVLVLRLLSRGTPSGDLPEAVPDALTTPTAFILLGLGVQAMFLAAALVPGRLSPRPLRERLGLVPSRLPRGSLPALAVGSLVPLAAGVGAAHLLARVLPPDGSVELLYARMTAALAVPFLLFITLVPGFVEELLFRGYVQRRLLERWPPAAAILASTLLFAVVHGTPHAIVFAFVVGLWLGAVAWRSGSAIPGMVCHASVNAAWNLLVLGQGLGVLPAEIPAAAWVGLGLAASTAFALSLRRLFAPAAPAPTPAPP